MASLCLAFLPLARPTFDIEAANQYFNDSKQLLDSLDSIVTRFVTPDSLLMSPEETVDFVRNILKHEDVDALLVQATTFVDSRFIKEIIDLTDLPLVVWGVREPRVGGARLSLNSATGLNGIANTLVSNGKRFGLVFGNPKEESVGQRLSSQLRVLSLVKKMKTLKIGLLGEHPDGFFFSDADPDMLGALGPEVVKLNMQDMFKRTAEVSEHDMKQVVELVRRKVQGLEKIEQDSVEKFARFYTVLIREIQRLKIDMVAVRNWPEFFTEYGAAAESTISALLDSGIMASQESDIHGVLTMYIQHYLAQSTPYFGDLVHIDETKNSAVFWHDGAGAFSLAREDTGAVAGLHPNRQIGFTLEFGLKPGRVSVNRLGPDPTRPGKYRMLLAQGTALDEPQQFWGTCVEVNFERPIRELFETLLKQGFEPHYSIVYAHVNQELKIFCEWLNIETFEL